jgi:hypothetical protein
MSALVYGTVMWSYGAATGWVRGVAAHLVATGLSGLCVFFTLITGQGLLLSVFGRRTAQRLALALQALFVVVLFQALMFVPYLGSLMRAEFHGERQTAAAFLPAVWFVALLNVLAGTPRPVPAAFPVVAVSATLAAMLAAAALLAGSYNRLVRIALETLDGRAPVRPAAVWRLSAECARRLGIHPVQSAVAGFTIRTLTRSRTHLVLLAMYLGIGTALVLSTLIPFVIARGTSALWTPNVAILSAPLILTFCMLCGLRVLVAIPTDIKANWVLRLNAPDHQILEAVRGVRMALLLTVVAPAALLAGVVGLALWDAKAAAVHSVFTAAGGVLLVDLLLIGLRKIPFACTYRPGRSRARTLWPLYIAGFMTYSFGFARLDAIAIGDSRVLLAMVVVIGAIDRGLALLRRHDLQAPPGFTYAEEDADAIFTGFRLSEGLAAESRPEPRVAAPGQSRL